MKKKLNEGERGDDAKDLLPLRLKRTNKLKRGDVFLWKSGMTGRYEIHTFHSDAGYGIKTFTDYNEKDGSSMLVNWSGVCGVLLAYNPTPFPQLIRLNEVPMLVADWINLPEMPKENEENIIYSKRIIFKTKKGHEFKGWVRFDFECFVVKDRQFSFEYNEVDSWKYDTAFH